MKSAALQKFSPSCAVISRDNALPTLSQNFFKDQVELQICFGRNHWLRTLFPVGHVPWYPNLCFRSTRHRFLSIFKTNNIFSYNKLVIWWRLVKYFTITISP